ncbi:SbcC/MukB-like Walker B domain-containing protein [Geofilum sp. OHC36d9]|uniref:SbcC/MukB-like Walker B domain-containing protein n=1 Tax=Geofilum sp. OHC36d9 TaxID=3458413 RepID=UPI0040333946
MKILNLKFKNINSLAGENEIDFTNPAFSNDGLFAITGKTGSGKSSILDAISLALYGKTPRVDVTGSENAVMTRGEKDCYSEIIFEVTGKRWKSAWKQELTRTGNLKPVNRVIADLNDKIIADQIRLCDTKIVEIIGLTFEQFTKVIMLAQGSFAAFLQADKNDKGELLEQITGTEIYGEISKKVFERNRTEKEKLEKIAIKLEAIKILSEEEIKALTDENIALEKDKKQIDEKFQKIEAAKKWLADLQNLQKQINEVKLKLPALEGKALKAKEVLEKSEIALKAVKDEQKKQEPVFKQVRVLDTKISEKEKLLRPILNTISEVKKSIDALNSALTSQNDGLEKSKNSLIEKQKWAIANKKYEALISNYSVIEKENQLLIASSNEIKRINTEIVDLQKVLDSKQAEYKKATVFFTDKEKSLTVKTKELEAKKTELSEILGGKELSQLQSEKEKISNFGIQIKDLIEVEKAISINRKEIDDINNNLKQFEKLHPELLKIIDNDKKIQVNLENHIRTLDENIRLTRTIQSFDEHRHNLKDGEECPLCGSLEHPFAIGNIPQIGEKEKELATLKKQLQDTIKTIQQNENKLAEVVLNIKNDLKNKAREGKSLAVNLERQKAILAEIKIIDSDYFIFQGDNKLELLDETLKKKRVELKDINGLIARATEREKQIVNLRDKEIPELQKEKLEADKIKNDTATALKLTEQQLKTKQDSATKLRETYNTENEAFLKTLKGYAVENIQQLKKRLDAWNDNKMQTDELTTQITTLNSNIALTKKELESQTKLLNDKQKEKQDIESDKQKLSAGRKELFAEKSVEEAENYLNKVLQDCETAKAKAEKEMNETNTDLEKNKAIVTDKEKELVIRKEQKITDKTSVELQTHLDEIRTKANEISQKIGANNQVLIINANNLKASGDKLREKEKQQAVCNKWGSLNELIGSGDGKKYRNFAQALTFEHLISLSNNQLQKMSDRYILKRTGDNSNPFELSVIDKFQNGEERTAQNLSGGEKFIMSLSLALGLSKMASNNMRIDTMFIDEGFGTLDSDYLDVALNALSNLQSEGKIIGVISHLIELKERIATHVEVVPGGNGHSKIRITN